jgi:hypothetical protein
MVVGGLYIFFSTLSLGHYIFFLHAAPGLIEGRIIREGLALLGLFSMILPMRAGRGV